MIFIVPLIIIIGIIMWVLRPGRTPTNRRRVAIMATVFPSLFISIAATIFQLLHNAVETVEVSNISNTLFIVGLGLIGAYVLTLIGFVITGKGDIAKGLGFGICISIVISIIELGLLEWLGGV